MNGVLQSAHHAALRRDIVGHDQVAALPRDLFPRVVDHVVGLGSKAHDEGRAPRAPPGDGGEDVRVLDQGQGGGEAAILLDLARPRLGGAPVADRGGEDCQIGRQGRLDRGQHLAGALHPHHGDALRIGDRDRSGDQGDPRPGLRGGGGDRVALAARGAVGEVAHGIDRLVGRPRGHEHVPPGQRFFGDLAARQKPDAGARGALPQQRFESVGDLVRLGQPSGAELRLGHGALVGTDHRDAVRLQGREVALRGRVLPHPHVHGRGDQDRQGGGEQHCRGEIRRVAGRHPRHQVGGGRRHHDRVGVPREPDMADIGLALPVEQVGMRPLPRERGGRQRRDEFLGRVGEQRAHLRPALAQAPDQVERLVGGDPAADDQEDTAAGERA